MSLSFRLIKYVVIALIAFIYSEFIVSLVDLVQTGDLLKYFDLYDGLINFSGIQDVVIYQVSVIGSSDPSYALILRYLFVPSFNFFQYLQLQVFSFVFLVGLLSFREYKYLFQPLRYLIFGCSLFSVYTLGLSTTLLRLQLSLIFILLSAVFSKHSLLKNSFYLLAFLTHISTFLIILPLYISSLPYQIRPLLLRLPPLRLSSRINTSNLLFFGIAISTFTFFAYNKILIWLPVVLAGTSIKSIISSLVIIFLLYPLMSIANFDPSLSFDYKKSYLILASLAPILFVTVTIGGFRTIILAFFMSLLRLLSSRSSFLNSWSFFLSPYPYFFFYSLLSGFLFLDKLANTGYGY